MPLITEMGHYIFQVSLQNSQVTKIQHNEPQGTLVCVLCITFNPFTPRTDQPQLNLFQSLSRDISWENLAFDGLLR